MNKNKVSTKVLEQNLVEQINTVKNRGTYVGPKKVLVIGGSSSYGLASRISTTFGANADTISVAYEKEPTSDFDGSPGYWNDFYFTNLAKENGRDAFSINGNAFSEKTKHITAELIKEKFDKIDCLIYSVAAPKRVLDDGTTYRSVIKPINNPFTGNIIDLASDTMSSTTIEAATNSEIEETIKVMGGEDWHLWIDFLLSNNLLEKGFKTTFLSYIGPKATQEIYRKGTLGKAKEDAEKEALAINKELKDKVDGEAIIIVNKATVSKASVVIPEFLLYISALNKVQKKLGTFETTIEHQDRAFREMLYGNKRVIDEKKRLRPDEWELNDETQYYVEQLLNQVTPLNFREITCYFEVKKDFLSLMGY